MPFPAPLRRRSAWTGLLATMLIVGLWMRSVGRYEAVEWTSGSGDWWCAGLYHRGLMAASVPQVELPTGSARFELVSEAADLDVLDPRELTAFLTPPVRVWLDGDSQPAGVEVSVAWWLILAVYLTGWAGVMAWCGRLRRRAMTPPLDSAESGA